MKLEAFDFSENVSEKELTDHIRYYYTMANIAMRTMENDKRAAMEIYKEIRKNLEVEYKEYHKVKNYEYIRKNNLYIQYVKNLTNAYVKPTRVTSYEMLHSNLYDVQDYIDYGFNDFLNILDRSKEDEFKIDTISNFLGKKCKLITKDYLIFQGLVDNKVFDLPNNDSQVKTISIFDFEKHNHIDITNIKFLQIV